MNNQTHYKARYFLWSTGYRRASLLLPALFLTLSTCFSQTVLPKREQDEIRFQARKRIEKSLPELLNTLSLSDLTEFERLTLIQNSYLPGPGQLFLNDNIVVEDDIDPTQTGAGNAVDMPIEKYLKNFDLFYVKGSEPTIKIANIVVSTVSEKSPYFVKVYFTLTFGSRHTRIDKAYGPLLREAELRAEKLDRKWELFITRIGFQTATAAAPMPAIATKNESVTDTTTAETQPAAITTSTPQNDLSDNKSEAIRKPAVVANPTNTAAKYRKRGVAWKVAAGVAVIGSVANYLVINKAYGEYKTQIQGSNEQYQTWYRAEFGSETSSSNLVAPMSLLSFGKPGVYFSGLGLAAGAAAWWLGTRNSRKAREADKKVSLRLNPEVSPAHRYAGLSMRLQF